MATVKEWLIKSGFDVESGTIIYQSTKDPEGKYQRAPGSSNPNGAAEVSIDDPVLNESFSSGYGAPECPRFIAEDKNAFYFPGKYDGSTWPIRVLKDIKAYLDFENNVTPYPGGG